MATVLSKQQFLDANDLVTEFVPTPELQLESGVYVRSMPAGRKGRLEAEAAKFKESHGKGNFAETFTLMIVVECACDEGGNRLFAMEDVEALKKKNSAVISRISAAGMRLSGFSKDDMEALEKNSRTAQPADLVSD